ncbi:ATP-binding protein [Streptomyces sp. NBC_01142]|uniref:ATP-binding protein n=1 Tax=Streptomyces sp. NBC_01142 TaxID=2975865 RepID=UPI00224D3F98|nr:ATP-binding protein [Streptomyces sp. NBC_01142]MCX4818349.1 ATP-binding protein [Streptomyces sp. NBC_01142]
MTTSALPPAPPPSLGVSYRFVAPRTATTPKILRDLVTVLVVAFGHEDVAETLRLCVSEVVTNAYLYTRADLITVDVSLGSTGVTVWVNDDRPERLPHPPRTAPSWRSEHGRGLLLLSRLADRWDVGATGPRSKRFEFSIDYKGAA